MKKLTRFLIISILCIASVYCYTPKAEARLLMGSTPAWMALRDAFTIDSSGNLNMILTGDLTIPGSILANTGTLTLGGINGTNNENMTLDFETTSNFVIIDTTTGVTNFQFNKNIRIIDNWSFSIGSSGDNAFSFLTTGARDFLSLGLTVGTADNSGYLSIMELADRNDANRRPLATTADPVLRIYSSDATEALDYIESFHNGADGVIDVGNGNIRFGTTTANVSIGVGSASGTETNTLALGDGNPPAGTANQSFLYANSTVGGSSELFAMDEAGNEAQITGNTNNYPDSMMVSVNYPYVNPKNQIYAGVKTYIAEHKALELLQELLRNQGMLQANEFIIKHESFTPSIIWEDNQERQRLSREQKIQDAQNRNLEIDALIASKITEISIETDLEKKLELIDERNVLQGSLRAIIPDEFIKKNPVSQWLISKGVKLK